MFIAKLHFTLDDRLNQWLSQCSRVEDVSETSVELIQFSSIFLDIQLNRFHCDLPPSIARIVKRKSDDSPIPNSDNKKKSKKGKVEQVRNNNIDNAWKIRVNESWDTVFKNKSRDGPRLSCGSKPCLKYDVKGVCYTDCPFDAAHKELKGEDKKAVSAFIKELRGE